MPDLDGWSVLAALRQDAEFSLSKSGQSAYPFSLNDAATIGVG
jgi:hypothetical protein